MIFLRKLLYRIAGSKIDFKLYCWKSRISTAGANIRYSYVKLLHRLTFFLEVFVKGDEKTTNIAAYCVVSVKVFMLKDRLAFLDGIKKISK